MVECKSYPGNDIVRAYVNKGFNFEEIAVRYIFVTMGLFENYIAINLFEEHS